MRVLLTGASGEIGGPLVTTLARDKHELCVLSRRPDAAPADAPGLWVRGDLRDPASLQSAVGWQPEAVVHMAAVTHTRTPSEYEAVNVTGTANLIAALSATQRAGGPPLLQFVHLSSRAIGAAGGAYSASKERAEQIVRDSDLPWTILRPAEVYGSGGDDPILTLARTLQNKSIVPVLGDGSYELSPVHAQDVVDAIATALQRRGERQTYVLAGPERLSYLALIERIESILGLPRRRRLRVPLALARVLIRGMATLGIGGYVPDQVPRLLLGKSDDSTAARRDLGFDPRPLAVGLPAALTGPE